MHLATHSSSRRSSLEDAGFRAERVETWDDRALVDAIAVDDPEIDRLRRMDAGKRDVP